MQRIHLTILSVLSILLNCAKICALRINHITSSPQSLARACADLEAALQDTNADMAYAIAYKLAKIGCHDTLAPYTEQLTEVLPSQASCELESAIAQSKQFQEDRRYAKVATVSPSKQRSQSNAVEPLQPEDLQDRYNTLFEQWSVLQQNQTEELTHRSARIQELEQLLESSTKRVEQLECTLQLMEESAAEIESLRQVQAELKATRERSQTVEDALMMANQELKATVEQTRLELADVREQLEAMADRPNQILQELQDSHTENMQLCEQVATLSKNSEELCREIHASKAVSAAQVVANEQIQAELKCMQMQCAQQEALCAQLTEKLTDSDNVCMALKQEYEIYRKMNNPGHAKLFLKDMKRMAQAKIQQLCQVIEQLQGSHQAQKSELEQERAELLAECELYEKHLEKMHQEMEHERRAMAQQSDVLQEKYTALACKHQDLRNTYDELHQTCKEQYAWNEELQMELAHVQNDLEEQMQECQQQQEQYAELCQQMTEIKQEKSVLAELYQQIHEESDQKSIHIAELSDRLVDTQDKVELLHQQNEHEVAQLTVRLREQEQQYRELHAELTHSLTEQEAMEHQCKKLLNELEYQQELAQRHENEQEQRIMALEGSLNVHAKNSQELQQELIMAHDQLADMSHQIEEQTHDNVTLKEQLQLAQQRNSQEVEYTNTQLTQLTRDLAQEKQQHEHTLTNHEYALAKLASLEEQLHQQTQANREATEQNRKLATDAKAGLSRAMRMAEGKIQTLRQQYHELNQQLASAQEVQSTLKRQLDEREHHSGRLAQRLKNADQQVNTLKQQLAAHEKQAQQVEQQFASANQLVDEPHKAVAECDTKEMGVATATS